MYDDFDERERERERERESDMGAEPCYINDTSLLGQQLSRQETPNRTKQCV